jgi:protein SCO1
MKRSAILVSIPVLLAIAFSFSLPGPTGGQTQRTEPLPKELEGVGIVEHLDGSIPLDLKFTDETGREVTLRDYFNKDRPVVLTLVYYSCPMLCTLVLNGMVDAMKQIDMTPGQEFEIVTVSFDPTETATLAKFKKQNYLNEYGRPEAAAGWHFLVGGQEEIRALTSAVGFGYRWNEESKQFVHQAAIYVLTPDGRLSRYLYGVMFEPRTLKLSLLEAGKGKIGSTLDQIVLYCFHYDATSGKYAPAAVKIMQAGGLLTVVILGSVLSALWMRDRRRRGPASPGVQS